MTTRVCAAWLAIAPFLGAQQPPISNASLRSIAVSGRLDAAIGSAIAGQPGPLWIGYAVPKIAGDHNACCFNDDLRGCGLEGSRAAPAQRGVTTVELEGPRHVAVLLRYEQGALSKVRAFSMDCPLDAGGLPFLWLTAVKPAESVSMLTGFTGTKGRIADSSVHAIAMHANPEADAALEKFATGPREELRKSALFWLAGSRGRRGYEVVSKVAREDASEKTREHAVFALTQSEEKEAVPTMIRMAKEDASARVRWQALFWLSQTASAKASEAITESIERDPATEVKKKAVFALSQLPKDEGVPKLIQVAQTNRNPAVRKQAIFWLGQSKDARALAFFEQLLGQ